MRVGLKKRIPWCFPEFLCFIPFPWTKYWFSLLLGFVLFYTYILIIPGQTSVLSCLSCTDFIIFSFAFSDLFLSTYSRSTAPCPIYFTGVFSALHRGPLLWRGPYCLKVLWGLLKMMFNWHSNRRNNDSNSLPGEWNGLFHWYSSYGSTMLQSCTVVCPLSIAPDIDLIPALV